MRREGEGEIKSYHDLEVWKKSRLLVKKIYLLVKALPKDELFALTSQIKRAATSIPANLAEGHARHGLKDYIHFVCIAIGSAAELETHLLLTQDLEFIKPEESVDVFALLDQVQKMLYALRKSLQAKL